MKLYSMPGACSMIPHTALEWSKEKYDLELVSHDKIKSPEYLKLNPQGAVPLLQDGDFVLAQNIAILHYINEKYPQAKLFGTGDTQQKAKVMYWLGFLNSDLHKSFAPLFHAKSLVSDEKAQQELLENGKKKAVNLFAIANDGLQGQDYLTGELTIADVYLYVVMRWAKQMQLDLSHLTNLAPFFARVESDAGVKVVLEQSNQKPMA